MKMQLLLCPLALKATSKGTGSEVGWPPSEISVLPASSRVNDSITSVQNKRRRAVQGKMMEVSTWRMKMMND